MNINGYIAACAAGVEHVLVEKDTVTGSVSYPISMWTAGPSPVAGVAPTSAAICTGALAGALAFPDAASGFRRLVGVRAYSTSSDLAYTLRDRLAHMAGLSGIETAAQTVDLSVTDGSLVDRIDGSDYSQVEWALEWYGSTGGSARTATVTYTNQDGTSGRTVAVAILASGNTGRFRPITPTNGDYIQSIQTVQLNGSMGSVGNFGVTATRPVYEFRIQGSSVYDDTLYRTGPDDTGLVKIPDDGCYFFTAGLFSGTNAGPLRCRLLTISG